MYFENLALAGLGLLLAGIVKGATGLGYASCALPFLTLTVGLQNAMVLVLVPAMATNISMAVFSGHLREITTRFMPLYVAMLPGIAIGTYLLVWLPQSTAVLALGGSMVVYSALALSKPDIVIPLRLQGPLQVPTGVLNGIVTGLTGSQVMPLFPYVMGLKLDPTRTVQVINLAVLVASSILAASLAAHGLLSGSLLLLSLLGLVPALAGVGIGARIRAAMPANQFRSVALYVLLAMGIGMLMRS